jgi:hypothetical protein
LAHCALYFTASSIDGIDGEQKEGHHRRRRRRRRPREKEGKKEIMEKLKSMFTNKIILSNATIMLSKQTAHLPFHLQSARIVTTTYAINILRVP